MSNDRVNKIAQELKQDFVRDTNDNWAFTVSKTDCYANNLPDGITMQTVEKIEEYNADFINAGTKAFGELAIEALVAKPETEVVNGSLALPGCSLVHFTMYGLADYDGKEIYGDINVREESHALNNPELTETLSELSKLALEKLEGKFSEPSLAIKNGF